MIAPFARIYPIRAPASMKAFEKVLVTIRLLGDDADEAPMDRGYGANSI